MSEGGVMAAGVLFMQWDSYAGAAGGPPYFAGSPLTFNTRQERLHRLAPGDRLWLVSRCPDDGQYYFVAALRVAELLRNPSDSDKAELFGEYAILADRPASHDLGRRFPAEGLLRAFTFETGRPMEEFNAFWEGQHGVRGLFVMDEVSAVSVRVAFKEYGRALGWGFPMGVGYRYLTLPQSLLLLRAAAVAVDLSDQCLRPMLQAAEGNAHRGALPGRDTRQERTSR